MFSFWPFTRSISNTHPSSTYNYDLTIPDVAVDDLGVETRRIETGTHSTTVYGYPSSGGALVLPYCNGVDLSFLGLSHLLSTPSTPNPETERSPDEAEEDRHCMRMRQLGAWSFYSASDYFWTGFCSPEVMDRKKLVVAAWPSSGKGVCVIAARKEEAASRGFAWVWNALSMDERCTVVRKLGGTFYEDPRECADLDLQDFEVGT
ncbi:uncharacterized protein F4822DRAFT_40822 [Hypoxylon trugodes]|uniref:uncharacterized protein n=1 Tax=Hypoxylon trugodes TaxID=326681 RepID=UPI00219F3B0F|nr:uncharacterized protein F4822DRAFT_40822 [Hypoxylon trugodes]KAI1394213.1 hypothetical protein F4822DRAFT_40822 [Hypoxylon trugodes]